MGRRSSIEKLPSEIKDQIAALRDKGHTIDEIMAHLNALDVDVSRSAIGRYSKKIDQIGETVRRSRILASSIVDKFGSEDSAKVQRGNLEVMHALIQNIMVGVEDGEGTVLDAKELMFLATSLEKLAKADKSQVETLIKVAEEKARKETKEKAIEEVTKEGRRAGLSSDTVEAIKAKILGL